MTTISLTMIVKNEAETLPKCLEGVKSYVDEMIVVDTGSTDNTKELAQIYGAKVYDFEWRNDFAVARNFSLAQSTSDWNLVLDADEYVEKWDIDKVREFIKNSKSLGKIKIMSSFIQNGERKISKEYITRLIPKGCYFTGAIHEQLESELPRFNVPIEVFHTGYENTDKSERNFTILYQELKITPENPYLLYQIARQYRVSGDYQNAAIYFSKMYEYIERNTSFYTDAIVSFLYILIAVKNFEKGLEIIKYEEDRMKDSPDFHFVCGIFYMNLVLSNIQKYSAYFPLIEKSYLSCLSMEPSKEIVIGTSSFLPSYNLGVYHETMGNKAKAIYWYNQSAKHHYPLAIKRLEIIK